MNNYIFEGIVSVRAIIESARNICNSRKIFKVYITKSRAEKYPKEASWLMHRSEDIGFELCEISPDELDSITSGNSHGGIAAVCGERVYNGLESLEPPANGFYVMLEGIEDPYNFGYALRTIYAAGADGVILSPRNWMNAADIVCRSSAGASELINIYIADGVEAARFFKTRDYRVVCADMRDSVSVYDADLSGGIFLVVGGEKRGISRALLNESDLRIKLEYGRDFYASLSASSAASVIAYEIFRRRRADSL